MDSFSEKIFIFIVYAYSPIKQQDASNIVSCFSFLYPPPCFHLLFKTGSIEVPLKKLFGSITSLRFDFDFKILYNKMKCERKNIKELDKIICFYFMNDEEKKNFIDLGFYLLDMHEENWQIRFKNYVTRE